MKLFATFLTVAVLAEDKKVPPKTPEERLAQLKRHTDRLMVDHFGSCAKASAWGTKLNKVADRALKAYNRTKSCSFFDDSLTHGGPEGSTRKRRSDDEDLRYSETDAIASINGITAGLRKWSQRYLAECGGQKNHDHLVRHSNKWRAKLTGKFNNGC